MNKIKWKKKMVNLIVKVEIRYTGKNGLKEGIEGIFGQIEGKGIMGGNYRAECIKATVKDKLKEAK